MLFHSLIYSVDGLKSAVTNQVSFVLEIAIGALLIPIAIWLGQSGLEIALMISVLMLVLIVELINSAIEDCPLDADIPTLSLLFLAYITLP